MVGCRGARWGVRVSVAVLASVAFAGCGLSHATPQTIYLTQNPGSPTPAPSTHASATPAASDYKAGSTPVIDGVFVSRTAPDGSWAASINAPVIGGIPAASAASLNDAIVTQVDGFIDAFANSGLPAVAAGGKPSTLQGDYSVALDSPTIVSVRFILTSTVSGAASAVTEPASINLTVATGSAIALSDIFTNPASALSTLASQAHTALSASLGSNLKWNGQADSMSFFDKAWAITPARAGKPAGLEFTWPQGAIASPSAGPPSVILAWSALKSIVKANGPAGEFVR